MESFNVDLTQKGNPVSLATAQACGRQSRSEP
jgi:hypothetical protein